jgi:TPR repeat protein
MKRARLLCLSLLLGCHRSGDHPPRPSEPIKVAAGLPSCADVADCERACRTGVSGACVEAGRLYEYGHAGPRDPARAFSLYERSCTLGDASGCFNAAILLEIGRGTSKDPRRAAALYERVCRMGASPGCKRAEDLSSVLSRGDQ